MLALSDSHLKLHTPESEREERQKARKIYSALSKKDCMRIFELAAEGIEASTEALARNGFSKKRYYVRLSKLIQLGLVEKKFGNKPSNGGRRVTYEQSSLGKMIYNEIVLKTENLVELFLPTGRAISTDPQIGRAEQYHTVAVMGTNSG